MNAGVAELVDAADLKSAEALLHTGSIPVPGIRLETRNARLDRCLLGERGNGESFMI
jgi:hypothetical protein